MSPATITNLRPGHMTEAEFDLERKKLRELYGDSSTEAGAKRDQALAVLFYKSGWTQEELAEKEAKTRQWVAYRLRFGRFLNFATAVANPESLPKNLNEWRFRSYWDRTEKTDTNERTRFREVSRLILEDLVAVRPRRPQIGKAIIKHFADSKWHQIETIAKEIDAPIDHVQETLEGISKNGNYNAKCERKKVGTHFQYRIFYSEKTISSNELTEKLGPIIKGLKEEGRKNMATMAPSAVAALAALLQRQLDEWTK